MSDGTGLEVGTGIEAGRRPLEMKGRHYYKTFTTAFAGDGKAAPPLVAGATTFATV